MSSKTFHFICLVFLAATTLNHVNSARILAVIPMASYSHQMFYREIWRELAIRGHDIVVVTTDPTGEKLPNFKEIDVHETYVPMKEMINTILHESIFTILFTPKMMELLNKVVVYQMNLPQVQELIHNDTEHFDLVMVEHFPSVHVAFKHKYKCPMIGLMSMDSFPLAHECMGNPSHGVLYPTAMLPFQENMNFIQRTIVFMLGVSMQMSFSRYSNRANELTREVFGDGIPDLFTMFGEADMLFINANPLFTATRPHTPSTINLAGGIHMMKPKPLPKDLRDFLDQAPSGVIYFSLGSNVKSKELSLEMRKIFLDTLSQLPFKVLWKFEDDTLPGKPDNVKITKWAPQQDILRHPNVKLFITQGGIQSLEESLYSNVPMVVLPFMADQEANAVRVQSKGIGLRLDPHSLTVEKFKTGILQVMDNKIYRENIKQLAARIQDEPMTPLERAVWWTEYVLRHKGAQHLKGPRIPLWQYYYFDVLAFLGGVFLISTGIIVVIVKVLIKIARKVIGLRNKSKKQSKSKKVN